MNSFGVLGCLLLASVAPYAAAATDPLPIIGAQPRMLGSRQNVSIESEMVKLAVHGDRVETDCRFVFANHGGACDVNIGFPDLGATVHDTFQCFVSGKSVKTNRVAGVTPEDCSLCENVAFDAHGKKLVRVVFTAPLSPEPVSEHSSEATYQFPVNASWPGKIGRANISVVIEPDTHVAAPLHMMFGDLSTGTGQNACVEQLQKKGGIAVMSSLRPVVHGRTLLFVRKNWQPTDLDNVQVVFATKESTPHTSR
jgi:hypothetical protein